MTRRENFLATLRRQPHEYMPAAFVIDNMNFPGSFPKEVFDVERWTDVPHSVAFQRRLGLDVLWRCAPCGVRDAGAAAYWRDDPAGGRICETPVGTLHDGAGPGNDGASTHFGMEWMLKGPKDYETLTWLFEHGSLEALPDEIEACGRQMGEVGDNGVLYACCPSSPVMDLVRSWAGIEAFAYAIYDFPDKVEALLGAASESYRRMYEMVCDLTPALILVLWDDATTGLLSRSLFERYSVPALKAFAQAAHSRGKILVNHTCGPIRAFADLYVEARQDAVDWLALPPTGDMMPSAVRELWNGKVTPMYAPDPQTVRFAAPETLLGYMKCMLDEADLSNAIVLLPCPQGTPVENARVMACYLSARCGSRFSPTL